MSTVKLTVAIREAIQRDIIAHRFQEEKNLLKKEERDFAKEVYNDIFSAKEIALMASLPQGWLPTNNCVSVRFTSHKDYCSLYFGEEMLFPNNKRGNCIKVYDYNDPMTQKAIDLHDRLDKHEKAVSAAKREISAVINSVTTLNKLRETWPEIAQFLERHEQKGSVQLPSVQVHVLNSLLNLPPEEKAA